MALNKSQEFKEEDKQFAIWAKALGHPARVAILNLLIQKQSCICGDLVAELPLSQSTVSQHLKELKVAGLITGTIDGPKVCYCIDVATLKNFSSMLNSLSSGCQSQNNCC